jgi:glycosyltransferase involved in cell wall biosynthesis
MISQKNAARAWDQSPEREIRYVVITPVRNEAAHLEENIASVVRQTVRPAEWVLVDDGSTDATGTIVDLWAARHSWIKALHRRDRGFRQAGTGVIEAFYDGYRALRTHDWEYLVKLDGDLTLGPDYFQRCFDEFGKDPQLGIGGGIVYHIEDDKLKIEKNPRFHVRGATKIYRRACWDALGGLVPSPGWDTVDELKAHFLGWKTRGFPELRVLHRRPTGAADGTWRNAVKNGLANYVAAYHPLFMLLKCLKRAVKKPYVVESLGLLYGFVSGYIRRAPRVADPALIQYIRKQQLRRLLLLESMWE